MIRCGACEFFNCGEKCQCKCHCGSTPKIRKDHGAESLKKLLKSEDQAMEGLSSLFG